MLSTQEYPAYPSFKKYSKQPYRLVFNDCTGKKTGTRLPRFGTSKTGVFLDKQAAQLVGRGASKSGMMNISSTKLTQSIDDGFAFADIDCPFIIEKYKEGTFTVSFVYAKDNDLLPITKHNHPHVFQQMQDLYLIASEGKNAGLEFKEVMSGHIKGKIVEKEFCPFAAYSDWEL